MPEPDFQLAIVVSSPFGENTYIAQIAARSDCLVIDPGLEPDKIFAHLDRHELTPAAILNTHGHADHIAGNAELKRRWNDCPLVIGKADAPKLIDADANLSAPFGMPPVLSPPADVTVAQGDTYSAAGFDIEVLEIPGHSEGHVVFLWRGPNPAIAFVGDVVFAGGIGRTDFPGGNLDTLLLGIRQELLSLPEDTILYPGHGPRTTVGEEDRTNPYLERY